MLRVWLDVRSFIESGGDTMWVIFAATVCMWTVTVERWWYLRFEFPRLLTEGVERAKRLSADDPWVSARIERMVSIVRQNGETRLWIVRTMVALCPLLGLLGTVLGMLEVFDVMSVSGNSNPRAMAAGVSQATITTLAGMASALSGLFFSERLTRKVKRMVNEHRDAVVELAYGAGAKGNAT